MEALGSFQCFEATMPLCVGRSKGVLEIHGVDSVHPGPLVEPVFNTKDSCFSWELAWLKVE